MATKEQLAKAKRQAFINQSKKGAGAKAWKNNRTAKPGAGGCNVDDGQYPCAITVEPSVGQKGKMKGHSVVTIFATIKEGEFEGQVGRQIYDLDREGGESQGYLVGDLKRLVPDKTDEIEASESIADIVSILDEINENPPIANVTFTKNGQYTNIRIDELKDDGEETGDDSEETADDSEESVDEETADDGEESVDEDETADEETTDEVVPELNDKGTYVAGGKTQSVKVVTRNLGKRTLTLKNEKSGTKYTGVSFDKFKPAKKK